MEKRTVATRVYLMSRGFTENAYSFEKDDFSLMKTTLNLKYEIVYKGKIRNQVFRVEEEIEEAYKDLTGRELKKEAK